MRSVKNTISIQKHRNYAFSETCFYTFIFNLLNDQYWAYFITRIISLVRPPWKNSPIFHTVVQYNFFSGSPKGSESSDTCWAKRPFSTFPTGSSARFSTPCRSHWVSRLRFNGFKCFHNTVPRGILMKKNKEARKASTRNHFACSRSLCVYFNINACRLKVRNIHVYVFFFKEKSKTSYK